MAYFSNLPQLTSFFSGRINTSNLLNSVGTQKNISYAIKLTDLTVTYKIRDLVLSETAAFYPYQWRDGDRPDTIAAKYYGDSKYWWVVFYSNKNFNLYYNFCLDQDQLYKFLLKKYVGVFYPPDLVADPPKFTQIWELTQSQKDGILNSLQSTIKYYKTSDNLIITPDQYATGAYGGSTPYSIYDYEVMINESKRNIRLLDRRFVNQIQSELESESKSRKSRGRNISSGSGRVTEEKYRPGFVKNQKGSPGILQFGSQAFSVSETDGYATITVTRTGGSAGIVGVNYMTANGTATAGSDYTSVNGTLTWQDGDSSPKTFQVPILTDLFIEGTETVNLLLSSPTNGAYIGQYSSAVLSILDVPPVFCPYCAGIQARSGLTGYWPLDDAYNQSLNQTVDGKLYSKIGFFADIAGVASNAYTNNLSPVDGNIRNIFQKAAVFRPSSLPGCGTAAGPARDGNGLGTAYETDSIFIPSTKALSTFYGAGKSWSTELEFECSVNYGVFSSRYIMTISDSNSTNSISAVITAINTTSYRVSIQKYISGVTTTISSGSIFTRSIGSGNLLNLVYDSPSQTLSLYVNGNLEAATSFSGFASQISLTPEQTFLHTYGTYDGANVFNGVSYSYLGYLGVQNFSIYNRVLTPTEISTSWTNAQNVGTGGGTCH